MVFLFFWAERFRQGRPSAALPHFRFHLRAQSSKPTSTQQQNAHEIWNSRLFAAMLAAGNSTIGCTKENDGYTT